MAGFAIRYFCIFIFVQIVAGRIIDLEYGYQEIEESVPQNELEKHSETIEELCLNGRIYIKHIDAYIDCSELLFQGSREVKLVKRDTEKHDELEGSGDSDDQKSPSTEAELETTDPILIVSNEPENILKENDEQDSTPIPTETKIPTTSPTLKESDASSTEAPVLYKNGFDEILKNQLNTNVTKSLPNSPFIIMRSGLNDETSKSSSNDGKSPIVAAEEAIKTGESKEKSSEMSPNNVLLIILGALGVVGILALVFNYVKKAKDDKEVEEVMRMEAEGRELKEMKPLMKDPLNQNGSKSLEYIDADPQYGNGVEVKAEVNHNHEVEQQN